MIVQVLCVIIAFILLRWSFTDIMLKKEEKKYFQWGVFLLILVTIAELGCVLYDNTTPENRIGSIIFNMMGFGLSPFVFLCESVVYSQKRHVWTYVPAAVNLFMVCLSPIFALVFYVTPTCEYQRGPFFFVYLIAFGFSLAVSIVRKVDACKHYPAYFRNRIIVSGVMMLGAVLIQTIFPQYHTTWIIVCVYFVLQYALVCEISSMVDGLTGLLNKTVFSRQMQNFHVAKDASAYLVMIDVNDFKNMNDENGHLYGDKCLIEIASMLKDSFGPTSSVYRFGGDEFCAVLTSVKEEQLEEYLGQLESRLEETRKHWKPFPNLAVGYEKFSSDVDIRTTIDRADEHMYENKRKMKKNMFEE